MAMLIFPATNMPLVRRPVSKPCIYVTAVLVAFFSLYLFCSFGVSSPFGRDCLFGASQFSVWGVLPFLALFLPMLAVPFYTQKLRSWSRWALVGNAVEWSQRPLPTLVIFLATSTVFFLLRNNTLNADGLDFAGKFARDVPSCGAHLTHDEILELYVHSRFWAFTHARFGWNVTLSYQVISAVAGGVFVCMLQRYCKVVAGTHAGILFTLVASGGFAQLFFGDVENYTLTAVMLLGYLLCSALYFRGLCGPILPSGCLGVAMMFHLLSSFMLPSLAYLWWEDWRHGHRTRVAIAASVFIAIPLFTLTWFHFHGLPIQRLFYHSHAFGHGGNIGKMLVRPSFEYYAAVGNLCLLLMPVATLLPLGLLSQANVRDPLVRHLAIASGMMILYMFTWNAQLGVYQDWNLFANVAIPVSVLAGLFAVNGLDNRSRPLLAPLVVVWALHTGTWIFGNHHCRYYVGRTLRADITVLDSAGNKMASVAHFGRIRHIDERTGIYLATEAGDVLLPPDVGALKKTPRQCICGGSGNEEADFVASWRAQPNGR